MPTTGPGMWDTAVAAFGVSYCGDGVLKPNAGADAPAVTAAGAAYCWGFNYFGQLGNGCDTTRPRVTLFP